MKNIVEDYIHGLVENLGYILAESNEHRTIQKIADAIVDCNNIGGIVYIAGNGGSASTSQHFAQGLVDAGIRAFSLSDNTALITALANDSSYEQIFVRQLEKVAGSQDLLIAISGSGKSKNIVEAISYAKRDMIDVIGILGFYGGYVKDMIDTYIIVPDNDYGRIEDVHLTLCHIICYLVKEKVDK